MAVGNIIKDLVEDITNIYKKYATAVNITFIGMVLFFILIIILAIIFIFTGLWVLLVIPAIMLFIMFLPILFYLLGFILSFGKGLVKYISLTGYDGYTKWIYRSFIYGVESWAVLFKK